MNVPETFFSVSEEMQLFGLSCIFGAAIGVCYDVFRALRLVFRHNSALVVIEDIIFMTGYAIFLWAFSSVAARGEMRVYYLIGNLIGFAVYFFTVGNVMIRTLRKLIALLTKVFSVIFRPLRSVFVFLCEKARHNFVKSSKVAVKYIKKISILLPDRTGLLYNKIDNKTRRNVKNGGEKSQTKAKEKKPV